ncbi:MAG: hypothetical protein R3C14_31000 [Caldilineaceae bacterium]
MTKFIALLPDDEVADEVTKDLSKLEIDSLDWSIITDENRERLLPAFAWPGVQGTSGGTGMIGGVVENDLPESRVLNDEGVDDSEANFFGRNIEHGGTAILIEVPDEYDSSVRTILENAEATQITTE